MNLFGTDSADGNGKLVRHIVIAGAVVAVAAVAAASFLDRAARDGSLNSIAFWGSSDPSRNMAGVPQSGQVTGGVRYGNVDYMPTATIPGQKPRMKNVVSDPRLGLPE